MIRRLSLLLVALGALVACDESSRKADGLQLEDVTPAFGPSAGGTQVTLHGAAFPEVEAAQLQVSFGGVPAEIVERPGSDRLVVVTPPFPTRRDRAVQVQVRGATGDAALPMAFTYRAALSLSSVVPRRGFTEGGSEVVLEGDLFDAATTVLFGEASAEILEASENRLVVRLPPADAAGAVRITVSNARGTAGLDRAFVYVARAQLVDVFPRSIVRGETARIFVFADAPLPGVRGSGPFSLDVGAQAATQLALVDERTVTAIAPADDLEDALLRFQGPLFTAEGPTRLHRHAALRVDRVTPPTCAATGGERVTVEGEGFSDELRARLGGRDAVVVEATSERLVLECPPGAPGSVRGTLSDAFRFADFAFRFTPVLRVDGVAPIEGPSQGGGVLRLFGSGLTSDSQVSVGGAAAEVLGSPGAGALDVRLPAGSAGDATVEVRQETEGAELRATHCCYLYLPVGTTLLLSPDSGSVAGGGLIRVQRDDDAPLPPDSRVYFGGEEADVVAADSDGALQVRVPRAETGGLVDVEVELRQDADRIRARAAFRYVNLFDDPLFRYIDGAPIEGTLNLSVEAPSGGRSVAVPGAYVVVEAPGTSPVYLRTDDRGQAVLQREGLTGPLSITAARLSEDGSGLDGHGVFRLSGVRSRNVRLSLPAWRDPQSAPGPPAPEISGEVLFGDSQQMRALDAEGLELRIVTTGVENAPGGATTRGGAGDYSLSTRVGDLAVAAFAMRTEGDEQARPVAMGLTHHVGVGPGGRADVDVVIDTLLNGDLHLRSEGWPAAPLRFELFLDLGFEGRLPFPSQQVASAGDELRLTGFPAAPASLRLGERQPARWSLRAIAQSPDRWQLQSIVQLHDVTASGDAFSLPAFLPATEWDAPADGSALDSGHTAITWSPPDAAIRARSFVLNVSRPPGGPSDTRYFHVDLEGRQTETPLLLQLSEDTAALSLLDDAAFVSLLVLDTDFEGLNGQRFRGSALNFQRMPRWSQGSARFTVANEDAGGPAP